MPQASPPPDHAGYETAPILIRALDGRSGTNYLAWLLQHHPAIARCEIAEDFLSTDAQQLLAYADKVTGAYRQRDWPGLRPAMKDPDTILEPVGRALLEAVGPPGAGIRPLLKTPLLQDERAALRLFPRGQMVIILRDPRSIAESLRHAHWGEGTPLPDAGARWAKAARRLEQFLVDETEAVRAGRIRLVRYERLVEDPAGELAVLFEALGMTPDAEALAQARTAPVIGSSFMPRTEDGRTDFRPRTRPADFDPRKRWAHWTARDHRRFNKVCGAMMERWGYPMVRPKDLEDAGASAAEAADAEDTEGRDSSGPAR